MIQIAKSGPKSLGQIPKCYTCKKNHVEAEGEECDDCYTLDLVGENKKIYGSHVIGKDDLFS